MDLTQLSDENLAVLANVGNIAAIVQQANPAVQQTTTMTSGLTPTEQALLSEEEKMIRLRNRGLA